MHELLKKAATYSALIPFAFLLVVIGYGYIDVPYWDEWEQMAHLQKLHDGSFRLLDLWRQQNEHRPLFGVALLLAMVQVSHWNMAVEIAANVAAAVAIFAVFARFVLSQWPVECRQPLWLLPALSLFVFSPSQSENWTWGFQFIVFLNVLAVVTGLGLMSRLEGRWSRLAGAMLCGIVATYSFASGLVFWIAGAGAWLLNRDARKPAQILVWAGVAILTIVSYFYDYHANPGHPPIWPNFAGLRQFGHYLLHVANFIGAPVAGYWSTLAAVAGTAAVALCLWLAYGNRILIGKPIYTFTLLTSLHCLGVALMIGLGRAGFGAGQALSTRYVTLSTPLWLAILMSAALLLSRLRADRASTGAQRVRSGLWIPGAMAVIVASAVINAYAGAKSIYARREHLEPARQALIAGQDDEMLRRLYPDAGRVRDARQKLIAWRYSVFRE